MKALVTGGGGFLGSAVVRALCARGDTVTVLARGHYPALQALGARTVRGSITNPDLVREVVNDHEVIFHVAAKAGEAGSFDSFYQPNVVGTQLLLQAAQRSGVRAFIHTSSPSVVTDTRHGRPWWAAALHAGPGISNGRADCAYAADATSFYSLTKAMGEMWVLGAARQPGNQLPLVVLRPHLIWGPGDTQLIARLISRARQGRLRLVGTGTTLVDTTYIDDAVQAHLRAADLLLTQARAAACAGRAYFISSADPQPVGQVINQALAAAGLPPENRRVPFWLAYAAGAVLENLSLAAGALARREVEPAMSRFLARQLATDHWFDPSPARDDLGFHPQFSVESGMRQLHRWLST